MMDLGSSPFGVMDRAQLGPALLAYVEVGSRRTDFQRQIDALASRVAALEAQTLAARWARVVGRLRAWRRTWRRR